MNSQPRAQWISVREAAAHSGASIRAIQKRAARGSITARKVDLDGVEVWEIDARDLGTSKSSKVDASIGANGAPIVLEVDAPKAPIYVQTGDKVDASNRMKMDAPKVESGRVQTDMTARLLVQLESENKFLRATVEQLQRDGAETRAALRAALKLTGETSAPQLTTGDATEAPQRDETRATAKDSAKDANAPQKPTGARQRPLTIGDIADEMERRLNQ